MDTITLIKQNIKAINKYLPDVYLDALTPMELLRKCCPLYRAEYAFDLHKQGLISAEELKSIGTRNTNLSSHA